MTGIWGAEVGALVGSKLAVRELEEGWNKGDVDVVRETFAPTFVNHDPFTPWVTDYESYVQWAVENTSPDAPSDMVFGDIFAEGASRTGPKRPAD